MTDGPRRFTDVEACVESTISHVGRRIRLGTPLGLGKANHIVNEFFRRAQEDPHLDLHIFTALTLGRPRPKSELERRFVEPLVERLFGDYPELAYVDPLRRGDLPDNIRVTEFYFQPGRFLDSPLAQQQYVSSNYTHVVRDLIDAGINVLAQLVAVEPDHGETMLSLSCNADLTLDLAPRMRDRERRGERVALLAQANRQLPFMFGDAVVRADYFDAIVDAPEYDFTLFGPPNVAVTTADYLIALYVSALVRDGGTLQLGIGSLGDAITYVLKLRHEQNETYRNLLSSAGVLDRFGEIVERVGGTAPFAQGLYAATEMLVPGFLELHRSGILKRTVRGTTADHVAHACFFLGPKRFYAALREMDRSTRELFAMTSISFVNELYGDEARKRQQRTAARFVNTGLSVALSGAVNSDALDDGRVVSGVGGQYNFVAMAHALDDGRAIIMIRSTRDEHGHARSNIRDSYGCTIPRHLRDIVVTEYGIADLRGRTADDVAAALLNVADSEFQAGLLEEARQTQKVASTYRIPDQFRHNAAERLELVLEPYRARGLFPSFPFGTDLTPEEITLRDALQYLDTMMTRKRPRLVSMAQLAKIAAVPMSAQPYLERMQLDAPRTLNERVLRRAVVYALVSIGAV